MLLLREEHQVRGAVEDEFDQVMRDAWLPSVAETEGARLLYYARLALGTSTSYVVVSYTLLRDAGAWGSLVARVNGGDLASLCHELDGLRHDVTAKLLLPLPWSPLREIECAAVPKLSQPHESSLYMEDTVWPHADRLEEYVERAGSHYATEAEKSSADTPPLLDIQGAFRTAYGSHQRREVILWQKVLRPEGLVPLLTREIPSQYKQPGRWMQDALALRDQWQSRLLRMVAWSPWY